MRIRILAFIVSILFTLNTADKPTYSRLPCFPPFLFAITTVNPQQNSRNGVKYVSTDYNGDRDKWARKTALRIQQYGFNAAGAWSDRSLDPYIPHTRCLSIFETTTCDISSPLWKSQVDQIVRNAVSPKDTKLLGYYLDNELDWVSLEPYASKYFTTVCGAVRKYDPNHFILGVRFNRQPPMSVLLASRGKVDFHSFNTYSDSPIPPFPIYEEAARVCGVKIIVSEFSFYARENRSGNTNSHGFGGWSDTQKDRAVKMKVFVTALKEKPYIAGCEWFQWNDEPPGGRIKDGEDCNFGIVDIYDKPYKEMVTELRKFNQCE